MSEIISRNRIEYYQKNGPGGIPHYVTRCLNEKYDLSAQLYEYFDKIGVVAYEEYDYGVRWELHDKWFTTEQIERMLQLQAFT